MSHYEEYVTSNIGARKPFILDTVPPAESPKAGGIKGAQFLDVSTNLIYEKTGYNNSEDWVQIRQLGDGGGLGQAFIQHSGEALANFIALNDDLGDLQDTMSNVQAQFRRVLGGGILDPNALGDVTLYALSTDMNSLSGSLDSSVGLLTAQVNEFADRINAAATVRIGELAPQNPTVGDLWWHSSQGKLKIYYEDETSFQWVDSHAPSTFATSLGGDGGSFLTSVNDVPGIATTDSQVNDILQYNGTNWVNTKPTSFYRFSYTSNTPASSSPGASSTNILGIDDWTDGSWALPESTEVTINETSGEFSGFEAGYIYEIQLEISSNPGAGRTSSGVETYKIIADDGTATGTHTATGTIYYPANLAAPQTLTFSSKFVFTNTNSVLNTMKIEIDGVQSGTYYIDKAFLTITKLGKN